MISKQEMLNRAVRGLRSQGWQRALKTDGTGKCVYLADDGKRCAWGWVDPEGTAGKAGGVGNLRDRNVGLAGSLDYAGETFATNLQVAHDHSDSPACMEREFRNLASKYELTFPED